MRRGPKWVLAVTLAVASGCEALPTYKTPPVDSYTAGTRQVKIGEAVTAVQSAAVTLEFFKAADVRPLLGGAFVDGDQASSAYQTTGTQSCLLDGTFRVLTDHHRSKH